MPFVAAHTYIVHGREDNISLGLLLGYILPCLAPLLLTRFPALFTEHATRLLLIVLYSALAIGYILIRALQVACFLALTVRLLRTCFVTGFELLALTL